MRKEKLTILIVNDYPLMCEAYKRAFINVSNYNDNQYDFDFITIHNCDDACEIIKTFYDREEKIDLVFLDLKLFPSNNKKIISGEDLGILIRDMFPSCKVILSTTNDNKYRIHSVFRSINPEGFLIKSDITFKELVKAINEVVSDPPFYSKTVLKLLRKKVSTDFLLDDVDRKILYELSIGAKVKDMLGYIPLSIAAIEKRKRHLKKIFNVKEKGHRELILKAKENGFI
ncbi:DNA-binding response regulator [Tenacibaculum sp. E3R01]|uniref:response regulator transcription factor n=1 Tax=unclassified Tenacibaculum TaxID=2635139 RepID=UPI0008960AC4|nr:MULTISPECIES: response regulator transcription factor [unclassified Tenacibaculum]RBW59137.1 DNA-binding response regulator [Tenacibaculum sp. E3R01]SEE12760.1 DNA-binding response regulator, NarL/FixJ family, contains REC and HTH domains [Tenacibaculum sp. MAR_2010_89]